jgi:hypothetical protein
MFLAEYYSNIEFSGEPHMTMCELMPNTNWGTGGPTWESSLMPCDACEANGFEADQCGCGVCGSWGKCSFSCEVQPSKPACAIVQNLNVVDYFAVRWTGRIAFKAGKYQFISSSDDGSVITVDGVVVLDKEYDCCSEWSSSVVIFSDSGVHEVIYEFLENYGDAYAHLSWCDAGTYGKIALLALPIWFVFLIQK